MPREEHLHRQIAWKEALSQFGETHLEQSLTIRGAQIFTDVYAEIEGKEYIIEIADVADKRKEALLE
jgi:hypothetical protein